MSDGVGEVTGAIPLPRPDQNIILFLNGAVTLQRGKAVKWTPIVKTIFSLLIGENGLDNGEYHTGQVGSVGNTFASRQLLDVF